MGSLFRGSGAGANGAHSYTGPPEGPDEVLDALRLPSSCGTEGSVLVVCGSMCKVTDLRVESAEDGIVRADALLLEDGPISSVRGA